MKGGENINRKIIFISALIVLLALNGVFGANVDNVTSTDNVVLNTTDAIIIESGQNYQAKLYYNNGTPIENQSITISINGIDYNKTTDVEGVANFSINLDFGVYDVTTSYNNLVNFNTIYVMEGTIITEDMNNNEIQKVIDSAQAGDNIIFMGKEYNDISLLIAKDSVNIISVVNTTLNGNNKSPVITVRNNGTNIANFIISKGSYGILIENASNASILNNTISNNKDGINVLNSNNVTVAYNEIINIQNIAINLKESVNTTIFSNLIQNNWEGIYFDENVFNTNILNNTLLKSKNNAIDFALSGNTTNIQYNTIKNNRNGIFIDCNCNGEFVISHNAIEYNNEYGIYFGWNFEIENPAETVLKINTNVIYDNADFNIRARDIVYPNVKIGANIVGATNRALSWTGVCPKVQMIYDSLGFSQDGNLVNVYAPGYNFPFSIKYGTGGSKYGFANFSDGLATVDATDIGETVRFNYFDNNTQVKVKLENYVAPTKPADKPATPETPSSGGSGGDGTGSGGNGQGNGNGTSTLNIDGGSSTGSGTPSDTGSPIDIASSSSSAAEVASAESSVASPASASESVSKEISDPTDSIAKILNVDEEVIRIAGMGFILFLIIATIGFYYRNDLKYMLAKRNEE